MRIEDLEYLTEEDVRRIRLVSEALRWEPERVVRTQFTEIIKVLACEVIKLKSETDYRENVIKTIEQFLEKHK